MASQASFFSARSSNKWKQFSCFQELGRAMSQQSSTRLEPAAQPAMRGKPLDGLTPAPCIAVMPRRRRPTQRATPLDTPSHGRSRAPFDESAAAKERAPGGIGHDAGELHRLLVESVRDYAIFALDTHGYILSWNAGAQRFKGYTASEIIGQHFSIFYPRELVAEGFPEFELRTAANTGRFEDEGWRLRKDGSRFWANVVITALRSKNGELLGFGKVTRD